MENKAYSQWRGLTGKAHEVQDILPHQTAVVLEALEIGRRGDMAVRVEMQMVRDTCAEHISTMVEVGLSDCLQHRSQKQVHNPCP